MMMWNQSLLFISKKFHETQNNVGPLNDHKIKEFSWVVTIVTGHAQHYHLSVTCPATAATTKTIIITDYLPYQMTHNQTRGFAI